MLQRRPIPLSRVPPGSVVRVVSFIGGRQAMMRILELGLVPNAVIRVVFNNGGPLVIDVNGARFSIGRGLASKILVKVP